MENGYTWSVELGIHTYFDNINQDFLINKIQNHISDDSIELIPIIQIKKALHPIYRTKDCTSAVPPKLTNVHLN